MLRRIAATFLCLVPSVFALSQDVKVEKYKLPNGMTVILHVDKSVPLATIDTWFYVGSKDEPDRRSGFAHLFEHLMFMGTERVPGSGFDTTMEAFGGFNNASTTEDRTDFYSYGPSNLLKTFLWLDADRLEDLGRMMDQKKVDLQREVVRNERRQNTELQPYGLAYEALNGLLFPKGHPYHTSVIGSHEDLQNASVQDVKDFFSTFYVPNNASLVVAGDFDPTEIKAYIAQVFGSLPRRDDPPRKEVSPAKLTRLKRVTMVDQVQYSKTIMAWLSPAAYKPGDAEMKLTSRILAGGISSRLYQKLVVEQKLATDVSAFQNSLYLGSYFAVDATAAKGADQSRLEKAIDQTLAEYVKNGPTKEELQKQVAAIQTGIISSLQSISAKADKLNEYQFYYGEPNSFKRELDTYKAATPQSVQAVAATVLNPYARLILRVIPKQEADTRALRDKKPEVGTDSVFKPQLPTELTLANGMKLTYWYRPDVPLVNLTASVGYGRNYDGSAHAGLASLVAEMMTSGTGVLDSKGFEDALDLLGADVNISAGSTVTTASMRSLSTKFAAAAHLWASALAHPSFLPKEWERVKQVRLDDIQQQMDDAETVARNVANREYFGDAHPAAAPAEGTVKSVTDIDLNLVKRTYESAFSPSNTRIFAAGSLPAQSVKAVLDKELAGWSGKVMPVKPLYPAVAAQSLRLVVVDKPDAPQTVIRFVMPAPPYASPDRFRLEALGVILGGSFTSRLNQNLRENKGYTYSADSAFRMEEAYGSLVASASVRTDVTGASLREFLTEFDKIRKGDVSDEEARKARATIRAGVISQLSSLAGLVGTAVELSIHGQTFADLSNEWAKVASVEAADINGIAHDGIALEKGLVVLVGDKKAILDQLKGLNLPAPEFVRP